MFVLCDGLGALNIDGSVRRPERIGHQPKESPDHHMP
jgi:hypothetical protein